MESRESGSDRVAALRIIFVYLSVLRGFADFIEPPRAQSCTKENLDGLLPPPMIHHIFEFLKIVFVLAATASIFYYILCFWSAAEFLRERKAADKSVRPTQDLPSVSILKPLKGTDPEMYESLRSHCVQDYPEYEILFGVSEADDPALDFVKSLKQEFPEKAIRTLVCEQRLGANIKVSNLAQMSREARYDILVVSDSDIRVPPDYLRRVVKLLSQTRVGLVTCLYRGVASATLGSRLESLGISSDFIPGVLAARTLERGIRFGLGSTLVFRRQDLQAVGGLESFADYLADDYELGKRIAALGKEVRISDVVVETFLPLYTMREFFQHQLRWARTLRDARPWGYAGLGLTFGMPWALLAVAAAHRATWAWGLLIAVLAMRLGVMFAVGRRVLRDRQALAMFPLLLLRDIVALTVWMLSFAGHTVVWRGDRFELRKGKLTSAGR
jgi:ceramide glucosyltransferase